MTPEEHRQRHAELHRSLDELFADFIQCNPRLHNYTQQPLMVLIEWSHRQTIQPDEPDAVQAGGPPPGASSEPDPELTAAAKVINAAVSEERKP